MSVAVLIPARYGSTRFPGKALATLAGRPVISHVVERALRIRGVDLVAVATDDERIAEVARAAGARALLTGPASSGTDRLAEAVRQLAPRPAIVVNLQGDEPLVDPLSVEALLRAMLDPAVELATLARPLREGELERPHVVKVVCDARGDALYFSRAPIPHRRDGGESALARAHVGVYAFREPFLQRFASLPPGLLEREESLEQLRALEHGHRIRVVAADHAGPGIDTPEDLETVSRLLAGRAPEEPAAGAASPRGADVRKGEPW